MKVKYSDQAFKDLKGFNEVDQRLVVKKIHYLVENLDQLKKTKKVRELKGTRFPGQYRFTIARKIRAVFRIEDGSVVMLVLRIGRRKDVYK